MPEIAALGRQKQEDQEFKASQSEKERGRVGGMKWENKGKEKKKKGLGVQTLKRQEGRKPGSGHEQAGLQVQKNVTAEGK
jgi:hypothetical protein